MIPVILVPDYTLSGAMTEGSEQRREWLDSLSVAIDTDNSLDISPLTPLLTATNINEQQKNKACNLCLLNSQNSFSPFITFKYLLPKPNKVILKIYNPAGQEIETLVNKYQTAGEYELKWISKGLPAGIYFCRLLAGEYYVS
jgi:hypothetical protein